MTAEESIQSIMASIKAIRTEETEACKDLDVEIEVLRAKLEVAQGARAVLAEPFDADVSEREAQIKELMLDVGKTLKNEYGAVSFRKGYVRYSWDNKALEGYAEGGHDDLYQFRKESQVQPSVTIKMEA